jgi:hypothetical protein
MYKNFTMEKSSPIIWDTSVIKKLPQANIRQIGENSPHPVTLLVTYKQCRAKCFSCSKKKAVGVEIKLER